MKFALKAGGNGSTARPDLLMQVAQKAEALGFESLWVPEHRAVPAHVATPYRMERFAEEVMARL